MQVSQWGLLAWYVISVLNSYQIGILYWGICVEGACFQSGLPASDTTCHQ